MELTRGTSENFAELIQGEKPVLIDFFAAWCGPCKLLKPILQEIAEAEAEITIAQSDIDEATDIADAHGIVAVPTMMLFRNGRMLGKLVGYREKDDIINWIHETV